MTENERLTIDEIIQHCNRTCENTEMFAIARGQNQEDITSKGYWEHYQVANYLEELKQYRAIGTVEEILKVFDNQKKVVSAQHETLKEYRAIGTIEEFKALKEKSVAKKPIRRKGMCYAKAKDGTEDYEIIEECPTCKNRLYAVSFNVGYCRCGQKITV